MPEAALSQREFDTWREGDTAFKEEIRGLLVSHAALHLTTEGRLATVEANQDKCRSKAVSTTTWLSALVSAIVGGAIGLWFQ